MRHKEKGNERLLESRRKEWKRRSERDEKRIRSAEGRTEVKDKSEAVGRGRLEESRARRPVSAALG